MLISYSWLQDFIKEPLPAPEELADKLLMHSWEVEDIYPVGNQYPGVVVGYVQEAKKHPNADRLSLCRVDIGEEKPVEIVCGGANVATGQWVPVATVGSVLPNGVKIEAAEIRGVESRGMICSAAELGEESDSGRDIKVLEGGLRPGQLYDEVQETGVDTVLDVDVLPNRASDCLSHRGVAREAAAVLGLTFIDYHIPTNSEKYSEQLTVDIRNSERCRRYIGAMVTGVKVKESPEWLKGRLRAVGLRPINNIVDATNYIMYATGQPLHAFDAGKFTTDPQNGYRVGVRPAEKDETIITLDDVEHPLPEEATVITDELNDSRPMAVAGVMGGKDSGVTSETTELILEAAVFDPALTRSTARRLKNVTDASKRFENRVSPVLAELAMPALIELLKDIAGGSEFAVLDQADEYPRPTQKAEPIKITPSDVNDLLGSSVSVAEIQDIMKRLRFEVSGGGNELMVRPPADRTDITRTVDVIEEVGRLYGYNKIAEQELPEPSQAPRVNPEFYWANKIRDILTDAGWSEVMTYTLREKGELEIANPLARDKAYFRSELSEGLEGALEKNSRYLDLWGSKTVRVFEIGKVYQGGREVLKLALGARNKNGPDTEELQKGLDMLAIQLRLKIKRKQEQKNAVWETDLEELIKDLPTPEDHSDLKDLSENITYHSISPYPYCLRDVAVWVPEKELPDEVERVIRDNSGELLVNCYLTDTFQKEKSISYCFRLVFQSHERTLRDEEVNEIMDRVYSALDDRAGWQTR